MNFFFLWNANNVRKHVALIGSDIQGRRFLKQIVNKSNKYYCLVSKKDDLV